MKRSNICFKPDYCPCQTETKPGTKGERFCTIPEKKCGFSFTGRISMSMDRRLAIGRGKLSSSEYKELIA